MDTEENLWIGVSEEGGEGGLKKKRKRKADKDLEDQKPENEEEEEVVGRDPLEVFGRDVMVMILNNLDARSVALSLLVSRAWHSVASSDSLWSSKVLLVPFFPYSSIELFVYVLWGIWLLYCR